MHVDKLHKMFVELKVECDKDKDRDFISELFNLYDENIKFTPISSSEKLALVRTILDGSTKEIGLYKYVDHGLAKITIDIVTIQKLVDIDFGNAEGEEDDAPSSLKYDKMRLVMIKDYLEERYYREMEDLSDFIWREISTIEAQNAPGAIMEKQRLSLLKNSKEGNQDESK